MSPSMSLPVGSQAVSSGRHGTPFPLEAALNFNSKGDFL